MIIPFVISGFVIAMVLLLVLAALRWHRPMFGDNSLRGAARAQNATGAPIPPAPQDDESWWQRVRGFQCLIGALLIIGGLWHAASPWLNQYSDLRPMTISNVVTGLVLAVFGVVFVVFRGGTWLNWTVGAIGVWVLVAPVILGFSGPSVPATEAIWGGPFTIVLAVIAGLELHLFREDRAARMRAHPH
jgi:hypothetical protein